MSKTKAKKKDSVKKFRFMFSALIFVLTFVVSFSLVLGCILLSAYWENIRAHFSHERWTYTLGLAEDDYYKETGISDQYLYIDRVLYLNMSDIALMCDLTVVGDFTELTYFSVDNNDQAVTFYYDSDKITVNGEHFKMNGIMFERDDQIYVPASFVHQFCSGVIVEVDEDERTLKLYRHSLSVEYDPLDEPYHVYEDVMFLSGSIQPMELPDRGLMFSEQNKVSNGMQ